MHLLLQRVGHSRVLHRVMLQPCSPTASAQLPGARPFTHLLVFHKTGRAECFCSLLSARCTPDLAAAQPLWRGCQRGRAMHPPSELLSCWGGGLPTGVSELVWDETPQKQPGWCRISPRCRGWVWQRARPQGWGSAPRHVQLCCSEGCELTLTPTPGVAASPFGKGRSWFSGGGYLGLPA